MQLGFFFPTSFVLLMKDAASQWIQDFLNPVKHYVLNVFQVFCGT